MSNSSKFWIVSIVLVFIAAATRILPHYPNVTALGAMGLFGAAYYKKSLLPALIIPFLALWMSDLVLNNLVYGQYFDSFAWFTPGGLWIYLGFAAIVLVGKGLLQKISVLRVFGASISASLVFFLLSNFGVWMSGATYPTTFTGLIACYTAGIPFFLNTMVGDLFYVTLFFGAYEFMVNRKLFTSPIMQTDIPNEE